MSDFHIPLDDLIAHRPPMRFLDRIITVDDTVAVAETTVRSDNPMFVAGRGLPAYSGLEMMAQAIAPSEKAVQRLSEKSVTSAWVTEAGIHGLKSNSWVNPITGAKAMQVNPVGNRGTVKA